MSASDGDWLHSSSSLSTTMTWVWSKTIDMYNVYNKVDIFEFSGGGNL